MNIWLLGVSALVAVGLCALGLRVRAGRARRSIAPGPPGKPLLGNMQAFLTRGPELFQSSWREYGDVLRFNIGPVLFHMVLKPEYVHHVLMGNRQNYVKGSIFRRFRSLTGTGLLTSEGEVWQRQRRLLQPTFTAHAVERFVPPIALATGELVARWQAAARRGEPLDIHAEMTSLAMKIISRTTLGIDMGAEAGELGAAVEHLLREIGDRTVALVDPPLLIPTPSNLRFNKALRTMDRFIFDLIAKRTKDPTPRDDLLGILLDARDADSGQGMSERQLRDEVFTVFLAGHETTALALFWTWRMLARHPEVERRMKRELDEVLGDKPIPEAADVRRLEYTGRVISESMRLYPPIWVMGRDVVADDTIGGYHIPAGSKLMLSPLITHRHPDAWEDPETFDPDRFSPERSQGRPRAAYLPLGAGPRACIGNHFATLEMKVVMAVLARRFRLEETPLQPLTFEPTTTLRSNYKIMMRPTLQEEGGSLAARPDLAAPA